MKSSMKARDGAVIFLAYALCWPERSGVLFLASARNRERADNYYVDNEHKAPALRAPSTT